MCILSCLMIDSVRLQPRIPALEMLDSAQRASFDEKLVSQFLLSSKKNALKRVHLQQELMEETVWYNVKVTLTAPIRLN